MGQEARRMTEATFVRRVLVTLGLAALAIVAAFLVATGIEVLLLAFAGVLVALFLRGLARAVHRHTPLTATAALAAVVLALAGLALLGGWLLAPQLAAQVAQLAEQIPQAVTQVRERLQQTSWGRVVLSYGPDAESLARTAVTGRVGGTLAATLGWIVGGVVNLAVVLFIGLYVAAAPDLYRRGLLWLVPAGGHARARAILDRLGTVLERWLVGKTVAMLLISALTSAGLALIGVPAALALGAIAGLLSFVPYLGPVLGFLPAALLGLTQSPATLGWVLALYVAIQGLESYVVTPLIQQQAVALPPALILTAQVLLGVAVGWLGVLLATPLTACAVVILGQLYGEPHAPSAGAAPRDRDAAA
jgi:predicted PurR-regulated permease PerM